MTLKNDYKVIYEVIENREDAGLTRVFKASKTGVFADAEVIGEAKIGEYKLIYEKDGKIYGSTSGIPSEDVANDFCFEDFEKVFVEATTEDSGTDDDDANTNAGADNDGDSTSGSDTNSDSSTTPEEDENTSKDPADGNETEPGNENGTGTDEGTEGNDNELDTELPDADPTVDPDSTPEDEENE